MGLDLTRCVKDLKFQSCWSDYLFIALEELQKLKLQICDYIYQKISVQQVLTVFFDVLVPRYCISSLIII